jgi:hypothetical protein
MNREGFYTLFFQGAAGWGGAILVLDTGLVVGADGGGGTYDGKYQYNPATNNLDLDIEVTMAPGSQSVLGVKAGSQPLKLPFKISIPRGQFTGMKHRIQGPGGSTLDIVLNKIRDFPP